MRAPSGSRWQILLMEYEILDSYWLHLSRNLWLSALVLVGLSTVGLTFLAAGVFPTDTTFTAVSLIAAVAVLLTLGWWFLIQQMHAYQRVTEIRKREIERELGMRMELYLGYVRELRRGERRRGRVREVVRRQEGAEESAEQEPVDLSHLQANVNLRPSMLHGIIREQDIWNVLPWLLIAAWVALWVLELVQ